MGNPRDRHLFAFTVDLSKGLGTSQKGRSEIGPMDEGNMLTPSLVTEPAVFVLGSI